MSIALPFFLFTFSFLVSIITPVLLIIKFREIGFLLAIFFIIFLMDSTNVLWCYISPLFYDVKCSNSPDSQEFFDYWIPYFSAIYCSIILIVRYLFLLIKYLLNNCR